MRQRGGHRQQRGLRARARERHVLAAHRAPELGAKAIREAALGEPAVERRVHQRGQLRAPRSPGRRRAPASRPARTAASRTRPRRSGAPRPAPRLGARRGAPPRASKPDVGARHAVTLIPLESQPAIPRPVIVGLLFAGAALLSGLTMLNGIQPNDEGLMLQAAARIAHGQVPYRDFWWFYPPGQPYLLGGLWALFGPSLLTWRIVRVLTDATVAVLAYFLALRAAPPRLALISWFATACAMAFPSGPHPFPIAIACVPRRAAAVRAPARARRRAGGGVCRLAARVRALRGGGHPPLGRAPSRVGPAAAAPGCALCPARGGDGGGPLRARGDRGGVQPLVAPDRELPGHRPSRNIRACRSRSTTRGR